VHAVENLVAWVMGTSPLPRDDSDVTLLLVGLRRQLTRLEQILQNADAAPALVIQAHRMRQEPVPEDRMPLVILTIRHAEIAHDLIDAIPVSVLPRRTDTQGFLSPRRPATARPPDRCRPRTRHDRTDPLPRARPNTGRGPNRILRVAGLDLRPSWSVCSGFTGELRATRTDPSPATPCAG
jgi:hypothetical protein